MERLRSHETAAHGALSGSLTSASPAICSGSAAGPGANALDSPFVTPECPTDLEIVIAGLRRGVPARVLIIGDNAAVARVLAEILKHSGQPLYDGRSGRGLALPVDRGTAILHDVSTLHVREQQQVSAWLTECGSDCSVFATSAEPLFPAVTSGAFSPALFYRLNVVTIECARLPPA